ncbi:hypothetical protein [Enterococcus xiangfangensis]|uniref:Major tail protein n=1 Tax=Enterococcus xiangfangensis TaxID=1296537 RepID=A0ABU3F9C5_9ENTE|nr:hypothetical protein [Enterococcus xiangfangensis]MDT2759269.1 hypothetical protein [Enterococcus xiangfangensis]
MAKDQFYHFDKKNIQGGAGRLIIGEDTDVRPTKISDIMDMNTFELKEGFRDLGGTTEGINRSRGNEVEEVTIDQSVTPIDSTISGWSNTIGTTLMETSIDNRALAWAGGDITETAAVLGTPATLAAAVNKGNKKIKVEEGKGVDFADVKFAKIGEETIAIAQVSGDIVTLKKGVTTAYTTTDTLVPVQELGTKTISYGAPTSVDSYSLTLIVKREDESFLMIHYYEVKISDNVETNHGKEKATLPVSFTAFAQDDLPEDGNVFIEIDQVM